MKITSITILSLGLLSASIFAEEQASSMAQASDEIPVVAPESFVTEALTAVKQEGSFMITNTTAAFFDIAGFNDQGQHIVSYSCGGTFHDPNTCTKNIPQEVTSLIIHANFSDGTEFIRVISREGFLGKTVFCSRQFLQPIQCVVN
jgi:hypothetical protein